MGFSLQPVHVLLAATTPAALACLTASVDGSHKAEWGRSARHAAAEIDAGQAAVEIDAGAGEPEKAE